jgi:small GTP-binding protein
MLTGSISDDSGASVPTFKVAFLGDSSVGKTSIVQRFYDDTFELQQDTTIGAALVQKKVDTDYGTIQLNIWDTAGQERYRSLVSAYTRGSDAAIVCFACDVFSTFENLDEWIKELKKQCQNCLIVACGNKSDLECSIPTDTLSKWSDMHQIPIFKTSAKNGVGIEEMFSFISGTLVENMRKGLENTDMDAALTPNKKQSCC